jgi:HSP20 family protein
MLTLPWEIDAEHVEAKLHDGVLTIRLPKSEAAKPRKIKVQAA